MYVNYTNNRMIANVGYQDKSKRNFDQGSIIPMKSVHRPISIATGGITYLYTDIDGSQIGSGQRGSGFETVSDGMVNLNTIYDAFTQLKTMAKSNISQEIQSGVRNKLGKWQNKNHPNFRPGFPGELHMINSKGVSYNFVGPGTHIKKRLARGDPPLDGPTGLDSCARIHDIKYHNAFTKNDVREADNKFIECVKNSSAGNVSKRLIRGIIGAKMFGENTGLTNINTFTDLPNLNKTGDDIDHIGTGNQNITVSGQDPNEIGSKIVQRKRKKKKDPAANLRKKLLK